MPDNRDSDQLEVELPAGGKMHLLDAEEVELWTNLSARYREDYRLRKINDLVALGSILMHQLTLFRAQRRLSGLEPEYDEEGLFTGKMKKVKVTQASSSAATADIGRSSKEIREIEKSLGIDKKGREAAGDQDIPSYLRRLKAFGREMGIHISRRVHAYEEFVNELRWRVRLEQTGDPEDKAYHDCTPEGILKWARGELDKLTEIDKQFAEDKQKLVVGKL